MKIKLIDKETKNVEYVVKQKTTKEGYEKFILKTSKSDVWQKHAKNKIEVVLIDNGNDYVIDLPGINSITLDASQLNVLYLVIDNFIKETDNFSSGYDRYIKK